jgi:hypothetical protein
LFSQDFILERLNVHKVMVPYTDYINDGEQRIEEMYFNINAFELAEIAASFGEEDIEKYMHKAFSDGGNYQNGFKVLKLLFVAGYGRRKMDDESGRYRFYKNPDWVAQLLPSPEFEAFYLKLTDDAKFAAEFWNGMVSKELLERAKKLQKAEPVKALTDDTNLPIDEQIRRLQRLRDSELADKVAANEV